ncbi:hypothetical protein ACVWZW_007026 [Bradyrhizobium sp. F1.13.4]
MAKKPGTNPKGEFAFFNVFYEDGSQRSNRRVPAELLGGLDGDEPARAFIMEQDREIARKIRPPADGNQEPRASRREEEVSFSPIHVIASGAKQSTSPHAARWIASLRSQ